MMLVDIKYMREKYQRQIDSFNINKLSKRAIRKVFKDEDSTLVENYLHNLVDAWFQREYQNDQPFFVALKKLIKRTGIHLNEIEEHDMFIIEERVFSIDRHIKVLEVDFELGRNEKAGAKFTRAKFFKKTNNRLRQIDSGDLIFTNKRIILLGYEKNTFNWKDIIEKDYQDTGFTFKINGTNYVLRIHDQIALNNTIKNLLSKSKTK